MGHRKHPHFGELLQSGPLPTVPRASGVPRWALPPLLLRAVEASPPAPVLWLLFTSNAAHVLSFSADFHNDTAPDPATLQVPLAVSLPSCRETEPQVHMMCCVTRNTMTLVSRHTEWPLVTGAEAWKVPPPRANRSIPREPAPGGLRSSAPPSACELVRTQPPRAWAPRHEMWDKAGQMYGD